MTAKPWPHEWPNMCAVTGIVRGRRAFVGYRLKSGPVFSPMLMRVLTAEELEAVGDLQPDLDDDGTVGHLKGMVREASGDPWYVLEPGTIRHSWTDGDTSPGWYEPITALPYPTEGKAYVAALDHLAKEVGKDKTITVLIEMAHGQLPPSLVKPAATFHGGGFVSSTADDEVSVTLGQPNPDHPPTCPASDGGLCHCLGGFGERVR